MYVYANFQDAATYTKPGHQESYVTREEAELFDQPSYKDIWYDD